MEWLKRNWVFVILAILTVGAGLFFAAYWNDANRLSALGAFVSFLVTEVLVVVTVQYVRTNQSTVRLLEAQWNLQNEIGLKFGLRILDDKVQVWILNSGLRDLVVTKFVFRFPGRKRIPIHKNIIVRSGEKTKI